MKKKLWVGEEDENITLAGCPNIFNHLDNMGNECVSCVVQRQSQMLNKAYFFPVDYLHIQ